jgi:hypothetical protein
MEASAEAISHMESFAKSVSEQSGCFAGWFKQSKYFSKTWEYCLMKVLVICFHPDIP